MAGQIVPASCLPRRIVSFYRSVVLRKSTGGVRRNILRRKLD